MIEQDTLSLYSRWLTLSGMTTEEISKSDIIAAVREYKLGLRVKNLNLAVEQINAKYKFKRIQEAEYLESVREIAKAKEAIHISLNPIVVRA